jgi:hypothetical protein
MPTPLGVYRKVRTVEYLAQYNLLLTFDDGEQRLIDLEPLLRCSSIQILVPLSGPTAPTSIQTFYTTGLKSARV